MGKNIVIYKSINFSNREKIPRNKCVRTNLVVNIGGRECSKRLPDHLAFDIFLVKSHLDILCKSITVCASQITSGGAKYEIDYVALF